MAARVLRDGGRIVSLPELGARVRAARLAAEARAPVPALRDVPRQDLAAASAAPCGRPHLAMPALVCAAAGAVAAPRAAARPGARGRGPLRRRPSPSQTAQLAPRARGTAVAAAAGRARHHARLLGRRLPGRPRPLRAAARAAVRRSRRISPSARGHDVSPTPCGWRSTWTTSTGARARASTRRARSRSSSPACDPAFDRLVVAGRVDPEPGTLALPRAGRRRVRGAAALRERRRARRASRAILGRALRAWDAVLRRVDAVWVLGPQGLALPVRARWRSRGASASCSACARTCRPTPAAGIRGAGVVHAAADLLDGAFRALGRLVPGRRRRAGARRALPRRRARSCRSPSR